MRTNNARALFAAVALFAMASPVAAFASAESRVLYAKGLVPFHAQRWAEAQALFDQAAKADPEDALAAYYRGLTYARMGNTDQAIADVERALGLRPDLPGAALDLGILYFERGQYETAEPWLQRAHQLPSDRFSAALYLGLMAYRRGDDAAAHALLAEAAKDPGVRATASYYDGLALLRMGERDAGREALARAAGAQPDAEVARAARQYLDSAVTAPRRVAGAKPWGVYGDLGFEYDSNVVLAPNDSAIEDSRGISDKSDGRSVLGAGGYLRLADTDQVRATLSYDLSQSIHFQLNEYDLQGHRVRLDLSTPLRQIQVGISGAYDFYLLDFHSFYQQGEAIPWVTFYEGDVTATQVHYRFRGRDYLHDPFDPYRDSFNNAVGVRQYFLLGAVDRVLSIGYQLDDEDPISTDGNDFEYLGHAIDLNFEFNLLDWVSGVAGYQVRLDDYQFKNSRTGTPPSFGVRRHDVDHQVVVRLERPLTPYLIAAVEYLGVFNTSNIEPFEYDRHIVSAGLRVQF